MFRSTIVAALLLTAFALAQTPQAKPKQAPDKKPASPTVVVTATPIAAPKADYSKEAFVVEQSTTVYRFETDGTLRKTTSARYKVQSEAALQRLGQLIFGYSSATERLKVDFVRVHKANGTVITAPDTAQQDLSSQVARVAPVYSDFREKHVTVPALRPGEVLEYQTTTETFQPLAQGQFWMDYSFERNAIVLDESLVVDVPRARTVKLKTKTGYEPAKSDEGERRIYRWTRKNLEHPDDDKKLTGAMSAKRRKDLETADVQLTTFASWDELAKWYSGLEKERRKPDEAIKAKAAELTRDKKTDREKVEAIYDFVATEYRYVSLSFGTGRFQPHAAGEVFAAQYGDCKDKHTLLAAMLSAVGITTDTVLIHSSRKLDEEVPSPSQFDHVISAVRMGDKRTWLDTTSEVAPYEFLLMPLRGKQALMITPESAGEVVMTPKEPPFASQQRVDVTGKVNDIGKLEAHVRFEMRGDIEVAMRAAFRQLPENRWTQLLQYAMRLDGTEGEVSNPKVSSPSATHEPFTVDFDLTQANFVDISSKTTKVSLPVAPVRLAFEDDEDDDSVEPIKLGSRSEVLMMLRLEMPSKYKLQMPIPVTMKRDYAEYSSAYSTEGSVITVKRQLKLGVSELPAARRSDLRAFARVLQSDSGQRVGIEGISDELASAPTDSKASDLEEAARAAMNARNYKLAVTLFKRVVELEPKHKTAWNNLGWSYLGMSQLADAEAALKKQIEINPYDQWAYNNLGNVYERQEKYEEAIGSFRKQLEVDPLDKYAHRNLGLLYERRHRYEEAIPELQQALAAQPDDMFLKQQIGDAYLKSGQSEKALAAFDEVVKKFPAPPMWNNVAYALAEQGVFLDRARQYAESAVSTTVAGIQNLPEDRLQEVGAAATASLITYWDTLGWVYFKQGDLDKAEKYISAAWNHGRHGEVADHLAQIYEKRGLKDKAIEMYAKGMAASAPVPETRGRLAKLVGGDSKVDPLVNKMRSVISNERTIRFGQPKVAEGGLKVRESKAEFLLIFGQAAKLQDVTFVNGSDSLKGMVDKLKSTTYAIEVPSDGAIKLVRKGMMWCSKAPSDCTLVLEPADQGAINLPQTLNLETGDIPLPTADDEH